MLTFAIPFTYLSDRHTLTLLCALACVCTVSRSLPAAGFLKGSDLMAPGSHELHAHRRKYDVNDEDVAGIMSQVTRMQVARMQMLATSQHLSARVADSLHYLNQTLKLALTAQSSCNKSDKNCTACDQNCPAGDILCNFRLQ